MPFSLFISVLLTFFKEMFFAVLLFSLFVILIGVLILYFTFRQRVAHGVLRGNKIYSDTQLSPGEVLFSKRLRLAGKPDYLIKEAEHIIPVEVKTGKTPSSPYVNHTMQLMAYCFLVEEAYGIHPPGGYLKYPEREFKIAYTDEARESLKSLVSEILEKKRSGEELSCYHPEHNISQQSRR